jgi:hypothetical protein
MSVHAQGGPTLPPWYRASIKNKRERGCEDFKKKERERERGTEREHGTRLFWSQKNGHGRCAVGLSLRGTSLLQLVWLLRGKLI